MTSVEYPINTVISKNTTDIRRKFHNVQTINVCAYRINQTIETPFLEYLLYKHGDKFDNMVTFPRVQFDFKTNANEQFVEVAQDHLETILSADMNTDIVYNGYYHFNDEMFLFFELKTAINSDIINITTLSSSHKMMYVTISEIINQRQVLNNRIHNSVYDMFISNKNFIFLMQDNNKLETPFVLYYGANDRLHDFYTIMGISRQPMFAIFGPFFYLTSFKSAIRYAGWNTTQAREKINGEILTSNAYGKYKQGGVLRYVIFIGNTRVRLNTETEFIDTAEITEHMSGEKTGEKNEYIANTKHISDRDGVWRKNYKSVFVGRDVNNTFIKSDMYCIDTMKNTTLLSYHRLNMKSLPAKYSMEFDVADIKLL